jgi:hypothetical protein
MNSQYLFRLENYDFTQNVAYCYNNLLKHSFYWLIGKASLKIVQNDVKYVGSMYKAGNLRFVIDKKLEYYNYHITKGK